MFSPELFSSRDHNANVFTANNGMLEARLYLSSVEDIVGVHYDDVPDSTFRDKRSALAAMTTDEINPLLTAKKGFAMRGSADDAKLLVIPSGRVLVSASHGAMYMRWGKILRRRRPRACCTYASQDLAELPWVQESDVRPRQLHGLHC